MDDESVLQQIPMELSERESRYLSECINATRPSGIRLKQLMENSVKFPRKFPISTMRCSSLLKYDYVDKKILEGNANSCYPLLHENALQLYINFLEHKKMYGNSIENNVYANMGLLDFVQRLLEKRPVSFVATDRYLLLSGASGDGGWEAVGTEKELKPLCLTDCLSYDEMKLSALLSVSSPSYFINDGSRDNKGIPNPEPESFTTHGIIIGLIGTRLNRPGCMEWQDIIVNENQNVETNGYGPPVRDKPLQENDESAVLHFLRQLWADFYGIQPNLPLFDEAVNLSNSCSLSEYVTIATHTLFNNKIYKKRISVSVETLLIEAETRAAALDKKAYVHVVGFGLGGWCISGHQRLVFLEAFANCLRKLRPVLQHISDINFSFFGVEFQKSMWEDIMTSSEKGPGINIIFSMRSPHAKLSNPEDANKLLIVSYSWNGALPGNVFWIGWLTLSGDPAAACSTQVAELHNPHINKDKVSGANLHIASREWGVLHISDYMKRKWSES